MASQHSELPSTNNGQGQAALEQPIAPPVPPPMPPWYFFNPSDRRVIQTFLLPKIRDEDLPSNSIAVQDVFGETPQDLARQHGYSEEKPVMFFFTEKYRKTAEWKRNSKPLKVITSGTAVIGTKIGLSYAGNKSSITKWHLDEYTAEGEDSQLAVYKLYTGQQPAHNLLLEAAQDPNPTVALQNNGSSSQLLPPIDPPLIQPASIPWNPQLHHGSSSLPLPTYNPQHLQQTSVSGNPHLQHGSAVLSIRAQQYLFQHLQEASTAGNPVLQDGSALPPYPSQQDVFQPEDSGHLGSQQILHANIQGNPQNICWSDFYQYYLTQLHNNPNANTNNDQPSSSNPPEH